MCSGSNFNKLHVPILGLHELRNVYLECIHGPHKNCDSLPRECLVHSTLFRVVTNHGKNGLLVSIACHTQYTRTITPFNSTQNRESKGETVKDELTKGSIALE